MANGWHRKRVTPGELQRRKDYASPEHRQTRAARVAAHTPASPCSRCGMALGPDRSKWHLPHNAARTGYEPGLWCASCNRREAASRGAKVKNAKYPFRPQSVTRLRW